MSGFEFTPGGIVPLGASVPLDATGQPIVAPGVSRGTSAAETEPVVVARASARVAAPEAPRPKVPDKPLDVVRLAKKRLCELDREIARLKKLEREREELRRLVAAALEQKRPLAPVRELKR